MAMQMEVRRLLYGLLDSMKIHGVLRELLEILWDACIGRIVQLGIIH